MRKNMTTWILVLTLIIGEIHSMPFVSDDPKKLENWIWRNYRPMTQSWNFQFLETHLIIPLYFLSFLLYRKTKVNNTTIRTFFYAGLLDIVLFYYNFKDPLFYGSFYVWMAIIWFLVYYWKTEKGVLIRHAFPQIWKK